VTCDINETTEIQKTPLPHDDVIPSPSQPSTTRLDDDDGEFSGSGLGPDVMAAISAAAAATMGGDVATSGTSYATESSEYRRPTRYRSVPNGARGGFGSPGTMGLARVVEQASDDEEQPQLAEDWMTSSPRRRFVENSESEYAQCCHDGACCMWIW
jgi:hypothetical protein